MGVHGLWKLLEPTGKPVPLETLENKVLAVDVSIWLHQAAQGMQDGRGQAVHNAPLLGLFHRLCKLLFCRVRPVFVFDGAAPPLKQRTVAARRQRRTAAEERAERTRRRLVKSRLEAAALEAVLAAREGRAPAPKQVSVSTADDDMFVLPAPERRGSSGTDDSEEEEEAAGRGSFGGARGHSIAGLDLHAVDVNSASFRALPADVRHDILTELRETRKQSSWGRLHEIPRASGDFSQYQMQRLLKRRSVQEALEDAEKEMGGRAPSLAELHAFMTEAGGALADSASATERWGGLGADPGRRIAADSTARFLLLKNPAAEARPHPDSSPKTTDPLDCSVSIPPVSSNPKSPVPGTSSAPQPGSSSVDLDTGTNSGYAASEDSEEDSTPILSNYLLNAMEEEEEDVGGGSGVTEWVKELPSDQKSKASSPLDTVQDFLLDNSDLSQEEILALIQSQKKDSKLNNQGLKDSDSSRVVEQSLDEKASWPNSGSTSNTDKCEFSSGSMNVESDRVGLKVTHNTEELKQDTWRNTEKSKVSQETIEQNGELKKPVKMSEMNRFEKEETESSEGELEDVPDHAGFQVVIKPGALNPTEDIFADVFTSGLQDACEPNILLKDPETGGDEVNASLGSSKRNYEFLLQSTIGEINIEKSSIPARDKPSNAVVPISNTDSQEESSVQCIREEAVSALPLPREQTQPEEDILVECGSRTSFPEEIYQREELTSINSAGPTSPVRPVISTAELQKMQDSLLAERVQLNNEQARDARLAIGINDQVVREAQELLQLFGIPYVIAPMEAEAQCAFLDMVSLTDGTITDDSDIWLFGGRSVYKNFFNHKKHVLQFRDVDIQHYLKLARSQLVLLALLVGSDYTLGLPGVGPVTALEILAAFPASAGSEMLLAGLEAFREWCVSGKVAGKGRTALRNKLKDVHLSHDFPSTAVVEAYLSPKVDESKDRFTWGKPDIRGIAEFTRIKFGWTESKTHDILQPIMKKLNIKISQLSLESYFQPKPRLPITEGTLSKRVQQAVEKLGTECNSGSEDDQPRPAKQPRLHANLRRGQKGDQGRKLETGVNAKGRNSDRKLAKVSQSTVRKANNSSRNSVGELILQREEDKLIMLRNKLKAIEVYRKSSKGLDRTKRDPKFKRKMLKEAKLSEESSSDDS